MTTQEFNTIKHEEGFAIDSIDNFENWPTTPHSKLLKITDYITMFIVIAVILGILAGLTGCYLPQDDEQHVTIVKPESETHKKIDSVFAKYRIIVDTIYSDTTTR